MDWITQHIWDVGMTITTAGHGIPRKLQTSFRKMDLGLFLNSGLTNANWYSAVWQRQSEQNREQCAKINANHQHYYYCCWDVMQLMHQYYKSMSWLCSFKIYKLTLTELLILTVLSKISLSLFYYICIKLQFFHENNANEQLLITVIWKILLSRCFVYSARILWTKCHSLTHKVKKCYLTF